MKAEEAVLTGEFVPVEKTPTPCRVRMCLSATGGTWYIWVPPSYMDGGGCYNCNRYENGDGEDRVSTLRHVRQRASSPEGAQPASKVLPWLVVAICIIIFAVNLIRMAVEGDVHLAGVLDTFMIAVSLAVAAIPKGLAAVVTIVLAIGVTKISKKNAIIRKLTAIESLGCAEVVCSDKTGTLTQNRMTVVDFYGSDEKLLARCTGIHDGKSVRPLTDEDKNRIISANKGFTDKALRWCLPER